MTAVVVPSPTEAVFDSATGALKPRWHSFFKSQATSANLANTALAGSVNASGHLQLAALEQIETESVTITFADNAAYPIVINAPVAWTIDSVSTKCTTGTCTAALSINGVALGGGSTAVSTTLVTTLHTTANVLPLAGKLELTLSANAAAEYVIVTLKIRRSFAVQS